MFVPITEQVFIPIHRIERISLFGGVAMVKYIDNRDVDKIEGQDAQRLMMFINQSVAASVAAVSDRSRQGGRK